MWHFKDLWRQRSTPVYSSSTTEEAAYGNSSSPLGCVIYSLRGPQVKTRLPICCEIWCARATHATALAAVRLSLLFITSGPFFLSGLAAAFHFSFPLKRNIGRGSWGSSFLLCCLKREGRPVSDGSQLVPPLRSDVRGYSEYCDIDWCQQGLVYFYLL